jgi:iron complex transport system permease protein
VTITARKEADLMKSRLILCGVFSVLLTAILCLCLGDQFLSPLIVLKAVSGSGSPLSRVLVMLRAPRVVACILEGAALGVSGGLLQILTRNVLATPDVLGVTSGASVGAIFAITLTSSSPLLFVSATTGGFAAAALLLILGWSGSAPSVRLVLVGLGIHALLSGVALYLLVRAGTADAYKAEIWLMGSAGNAQWGTLLPLAAILCLTTPFLVATSRLLPAVALGSDVAQSVGVAYRAVGGLIFISSVTLASIAAAVCGPIAFVGLVAPRAANRLVPIGGRWLILSALVGAELVLIADLISRLLFRPIILPTGTITGAIGAVVLLFVVGVRRGTRGLDV